MTGELIILFGLFCWALWKVLSWAGYSANVEIDQIVKLNRMLDGPWNKNRNDLRCIWQA